MHRYEIAILMLTYHFQSGIRLWQILSFAAVLVKEDLPSDLKDPRPVKIFYHLEDDTLRVVEPPTQNAGLVQGMDCSDTQAKVIIEMIT